MSNLAVMQKTALNCVNAPVSYLSQPEIELLIAGCARERDQLLIELLFQTGLRISEALALTPGSIRMFEDRPAVELIGKGRKRRWVALPARLKEKLESFAYRTKLEKEARFFDINRSRAWQILNEAGQKAEIGKRVYPHLLRHSDAIIRLRKTGNPKALQHHLGHNSPAMTMRYLSMLTQEDSLRIQQGVEF